MEDVIKIEGKHKLKGTVRIGGSKNATVALIPAAILANGPVTICDVPDISDVKSLSVLLDFLGVAVDIRSSDTIVIDPQDMVNRPLTHDAVNKLRASYYFMGALLGKYGHVEILMPGGCYLGPRPIDLHLKALRELGVDIQEEHGYIKCSTDKIVGGNIHLDFPSVGATENAMLAAVCADGFTTITNAAREPEIVDLGNFLNCMGAKVRGMGGSVIKIEGVSKLHGAEYTIMPDRIVAATYLAASAITGGEICLKNVNPRDMGAMLHVLLDMGVQLRIEKDKIIQKAPKKLESIHIVRTMPYPGFPTDIQSPFMALATVARGTSVFIENIFENRFQHVDELTRMGADIKVEGRSAVVRGVNGLQGANVVARELRGGAALVVAALVANGTTTISGTEFIDRGYENIEKYLLECGAKIRRE